MFSNHRAIALDHLLRGHIWHTTWCTTWVAFETHISSHVIIHHSSFKKYVQLSNPDPRYLEKLPLVILFTLKSRFSITFEWKGLGLLFYGNQKQCWVDISFPYSTECWSFLKKHNHSSPLYKYKHASRPVKTIQCVLAEPAFRGSEKQYSESFDDLPFILIG